MNRIFKYFRWLLFLLSIISGVNCKKYLDEKSGSRLVIPRSIEDLQAVFDFVHGNGDQPNPGASEASADNYYLTTTDWNSLATEDLRRIYTWEKDYVFPEDGNDWEQLYSNGVYKANTVLDNMEEIERTPGNQTAWDDLKGQAHFYRGMYFLKAALVWSLAYDAATADHELGIPLRLVSDFNVPSVRSSVKETYEQIIQDLQSALPLVQLNPLHALRPSKPAVYAMLARTYLAMRKYDSCYRYAELCLQLRSDLMDYNNDPSIKTSASFPFLRFNREVIFDGHAIQSLTLSISRAKIDSSLYISYSDDDLRKTMYFRSNGNNTFGFKGSYDGLTAAYAFDGVATNEVYLMKAECLARMGDHNTGLSVLNTLLEKRWQTGRFSPFAASTPEEALALILNERRKELIFRQLRWMDIKRLNKEGAGIELKRVIDNHTYTILPNDLRYALPIPETVIQISGMQQNPR